GWCCSRSAGYAHVAQSAIWRATPGFRFGVARFPCPQRGETRPQPSRASRRKAGPGARGEGAEPGWGRPGAGGGCAPGRGSVVGRAWVGPSSRGCRSVVAWVSVRRCVVIGLVGPRGPRRSSRSELPHLEVLFPEL